MRPIHHAIIGVHSGIVQQLLESKADANADANAGGWVSTREGGCCRALHTLKFRR